MCSKAKYDPPLLILSCMLVWLDEKDYPVFPSSTSISSTQTTLPASVPSKPTSRLIPIMKRAVAKIRRSITESTQIDHDEISTLHDPETKKEHTANILLENEISQLNDLIPELSLKELEQYLRPHIVPNSLHNEVIFVAGFDDQVIFFEYVVVILRLDNLEIG